MIGLDPQGDPAFLLLDEAGRPRAVVSVGDQGEPGLFLLDENGESLG